MNLQVVARASRPCVGRKIRTGETPVPLFRRPGSRSQCMRKKRKRALHEPHFRPRPRSRPHPRSGGLASRTRTSRRTIWFMGPMHSRKRKGTFHEPSAFCRHGRRIREAPCRRDVGYLYSAAARLVAHIFPPSPPASARSRRSEAETDNPPYRRIIFGRVSDRSQALARCHATQITNLRYGRVQLCATLNTYDVGSTFLVAAPSRFRFILPTRAQKRKESLHEG
jgi:hypothetical protein